jgi:hypothetical protein
VSSGDEPGEFLTWHVSQDTGELNLVRTVDAEQGPRTTFAVCVQYIDPNAEGAEALVPNPDVESAAKARIEEAFPAVTSHELWAQTSFSAYQPAADIGCPTLPLALTVAFSGGVPSVENIAAYVDAVGVDAPSYYPLFVFVVPELDDVERLIGQTEPRVVPQEFSCTFDELHGGNCHQVTEAAYVAVDEVESDNDFWKAILVQGAGLEGPQPRPD